MRSVETSQAKKAVGSRTLDDHDLMLEFESLGENVELGCIQRACGAEPLGLFRFTACKIENLCHAFETNFDHLFTGEDLEVFGDYGDGRFHCRSRYYQDFEYYVFTKEGEMNAEDVKLRERKKVGYLRRRLMEDLRSKEKIFVRKGGDTLPDLRRLHRALLAYGSHVLLLVGVADLDHPAGSTERLGPQLLRGFVSRFKVCNRPEPFDVASWLKICRAAHRAWRTGVNYVLPHRLETGASWTFSDHCNVSAAGLVPLGAGARRQHTFQLTKQSHADDVAVVASKEVSTARPYAQGMIVFSTWVRVAAGFPGSRLFIAFDGQPAKHECPYDFSRVGAWQHIWSTTRMPRTAPSLKALLCVDGMPGSSITLAGWAFDNGCAPTTEVPAVRTRFAAWRDRSKRSAHMIRLRRQIEARTSTTASAGADALIANGAFVEADDLLGEALVALPNDAALTKSYAISAHNSGRYFAAVARWQKALDANTDDPMCFAGFASNLREHLSVARAKDLIGVALARFPDDLVVLTEAARIADAGREWAHSLLLWEKAIALYGAHPEWAAARDRARRMAP